MPVQIEYVGNIKGAKGDKGDTGTIAEARAHALPADAEPTVTPSGPETARVYDFGIPRGEKGLPGTNGVATDEATATNLDSPSTLTRAAAERVVYEAAVDVDGVGVVNGDGTGATPFLTSAGNLHPAFFEKRADQVTAETPLAVLDTFQPSQWPAGQSFMRSGLSDIGNGLAKWGISHFDQKYGGGRDVSLPIMLGGGVRFAMGMALNWITLRWFGRWNNSIAGAGYGEGWDRAMRIVMSALDQHESNNGGWGGLAEQALTFPETNIESTNSWQAASWARIIACAAWMMQSGSWPANEKLSPEYEVKLKRMLVHEADRFLSVKLPSQYSLNRNERYTGNTRGEEIAWDCSLLIVAFNMMPTHPRAREWISRALEMGVAAWAHHDDTTDFSTQVNGFAPGDILDGSNLEDDYSAINHGHLSLGYALPVDGMYTVAGFAFGERAVPKALTWNYNERWNMLVTRDFTTGEGYDAPGGTIYDTTGGTYELYGPEGFERGTKVYYANAGNSDILAMKYGATSDASWMKDHWGHIKALQDRFTTGQIFADSTEAAGYPTTEEDFSQRVANAMLTLYGRAGALAPAGQSRAEGPVAARISNADADTLTTLARRGN